MQSIPPLPMIPTTPMDIAVAIAIVVGTVGVVGTGFVLIRAVVKRWLTPPAMPSAVPELAELREAVGQLSAEIAELHERMDFTERVLAQHAERPRIDGEG